MEIILLEEIDGLGRRGDRVNVSPGYARNYLLPRNLALEATGAGARVFLERERIQQTRHQREKVLAEKLAAKLGKASVTIEMQAGEDDRLFGSVTAADIAGKLSEQGLEVDRRQIHLEEPLKALGAYNVRIKLHGEIEAKVRVWVKKEGMA